MIAARPPDPGNAEGRMAAAPRSNQSADNWQIIPRYASRRYSAAHVGFVLVAARVGALSPEVAARSLAREAEMLLDEVTR